MIPRTPPLEATGHRRWMLVDDNEEILSLMEETVTRVFEVEVTAYHSAADALAAFQTAPERFQCVITDLEMPGMNGFELCRQLHAVRPLVRVLLATGSHSVTTLEARSRGFCGLLAKPFSLTTLKREMASFETQE